MINFVSFWTLLLLFQLDWFVKCSRILLELSYSDSTQVKEEKEELARRPSWEVESESFSTQWTKLKCDARVKLLLSETMKGLGHKKHSF